MKLIVAVIKPFKFDEVKDALQKAGVQGLTVTEVQGYGRQRGHTEVYRGAEYQVDLVPKLRLEIVVGDAEAPALVETLTTAARTGKIGVAKLWLADLAEVIRIRTGERGEEAL